jgi:hypothetical protein
MPTYTTKRRRSIQRDAARIKRSVPRDRRHLLHWAAKGTHDDYDKLRRHAKKVQHRVPSYIDSKHVDAIAEQGSRRHLAENVHESTFLDGLAWLIDQVPGGKWSWAKKLTQGALKPFRGDAVNEEDELYALLLDQAYKDEPKDAMGQWTLVPELGSDYVQVYDNVDGHRYIGVRGTKLHGTWGELGTDLGYDAGLAVGLNPANIVGDELQRILDETRPGTIVDVGGHSLATSLIAKAYDDNGELQDRIRQTYMYNPVFSPVAPRNVTDKYEADERVRWFIDLLDPVSLGDLGSAGPKNAVYRTNFSWNPIGPHSLTAWAGDYIPEDVTPSQEKENVVAQQRDEIPTQGMGDAFGAGGLLDFGTDNWDAAAFGL